MFVLGVFYSDFDFYHVYIVRIGIISWGCFYMPYAVPTSISTRQIKLKDIFMIMIPRHVFIKYLLLKKKVPFQYFLFQMISGFQ